VSRPVRLAPAEDRSADPLVAGGLRGWFRAVAGVLGRSWYPLLIIHTMLAVVVAATSVVLAGTLVPGRPPPVGPELHLVIVLLTGFVAAALLVPAAVFTIVREADGQDAALSDALRFGTTRMTALGAGLRRGHELVKPRFLATAVRVLPVGLAYLAAGAAVQLELIPRVMPASGDDAGVAYLVWAAALVPAGIVGCAVAVVTFAELRGHEDPSVSTARLARKLGLLQKTAKGPATVLILLALVLTWNVVEDGLTWFSAPFQSAVPAIRAVTSIPVADRPDKIAVTSDGRSAYVIHGRARTVTVIDTGRRRTTGTISLDVSPAGVALTPDGRRAYVSGGGTPGQVLVIDTADRRVVGAVPVGAGPDGVQVSPDGAFVYVANAGTDAAPGRTVSVIDTATDTVTATIAVGDDPTELALSPDGRRGYVTHAPGNTVTVFDTASGAVIATVPVGLSPHAVAVTPDGGRVYVANQGSKQVPGTTVSVIDAGTNTVTATVPVGVYPFAVAFSPDGRRAWVANGGGNGVAGNSVTVIDVASGVPTDTVVVGRGPTGVAVAPGGRYLYTADYSADSVTVVDVGPR
jgi:YVTN family beta-propeller protein